jgi:hypothetical protein
MPRREPAESDWGTRESIFNFFAGPPNFSPNFFEIIFRAGL